jgi:hypothetical protein
VRENIIMDRTTKILLATIALGLWANAAATVLPNVVREAYAQSRVGNRGISEYYERADDWQKAVMLMANGTCDNRKLC